MIVDACIVLIVVLCVMWGARRGFVRAFMNVLSFLIAIAAALLCFDWFSALLQNSFVGKAISSWIGNSLQNAADGAVSRMKLPKVFGNLDLVGPTAELTQKLTGLVVSVLAVVILILLIKFALRILVKILDSITHIPVLKQCNRLMGGVFGLATGFFWVFLLVSIISALSFIPAVASVQHMIDGSYLLKLCYENNFLLEFLPCFKPS